MEREKMMMMNDEGEDQVFLFFIFLKLMHN